MATEADFIAAGLVATTAPPTGTRISPGDVESNIVHETYFTAGTAEQYCGLNLLGKRDDIPTPARLHCLTCCVLTLRNGTTVLGTHSPALTDHYDPQEGRYAARDHAVAQILPLMGHELRTKLERRPSLADHFPPGTP